MALLLAIFIDRFSEVRFQSFRGRQSRSFSYSIGPPHYYQDYKSELSSINQDLNTDSAQYKQECTRSYVGTCERPRRMSMVLL